MSDFKVGEQVWFMRGNFRGVVYADHIRIDFDYIKHLHDENIVILETTKGTHLLHAFYKSKKECIQAFKARLDEL